MRGIRDILKFQKNHGARDFGAVRNMSLAEKLKLTIGVFAGGLLLSVGLSMIGVLLVFYRLKNDPTAETVAGVYRLLGWGAFTLVFSATAVLAAGSRLVYFIMKDLSASIDVSVNRLKGDASEIHSTSNQIAMAAGEMAQAAEVQASVGAETSASIRQLAEITSHGAKYSRRVLEIGKNSHESALRGKAVVSQMITSLDEVQANNADTIEQMEVTNRQLGNIISVINNIGLKTKVINEIVFQTRLLSFNAAVEAERAGEYGLGFAVVADEIGNLAKMSGAAADEITKLLVESAGRVDGIIESARGRIEEKVGSGKEKVETSVRVAQECVVALDEVVFNISRLAKMAEDIQNGSLDQEAGADEVTQALARFDRASQHVSEISQRSIDAAGALADQAMGSLDRSVNALEALNGGKKEAAVKPSPALQEAAASALKIKTAA